MNFSKDVDRCCLKFRQAIGCRVLLLLTLWGICFYGSFAEAESIGARYIQLLDNGKPVSGAIVSVGYYQGVTDETGHMLVDLYPGTYEVDIRLNRGALPILFTAIVKKGQEKLVLDFKGRIERDQGGTGPVIFVLARFDAAEGLIEFWHSKQETMKQVFGDIKAVVIRDGGYAVVKAGMPLRNSQDIDVLKKKADSSGLDSSFTVSVDAIVADLAEHNPLDKISISKTLINLLESNDIVTRRNARLAVGELGPEVAPILVDIVSGQNYRKDLGAMVALSKIKSWPASEESIRKLYDATAFYKGDRVVQSAFWDALKSAKTDMKLSFLGFENNPESIREFQIQSGFTPDGLMGPKTLYKINELVLNRLRRQSGQKWAEYKIRAYSFNVDEPLILKATDLMQRNGVSLRSVPLFNERPSWLALKSTVFYYAEESRSKAEDIAQIFEEELSMRFDVKPGAGLGVQPGEKAITFFVHIINSN